MAALHTVMFAPDAVCTGPNHVGDKHGAAASQTAPEASSGGRLCAGIQATVPNQTATASRGHEVLAPFTPPAWQDRPRFPP